MKIIIRANGGAKIGMGHIMRSSVLADQLRKFAHVIFVCEDLEEFKPGVDYLVKKNYKVILVKPDKLISKLKNVSADVLITDSYDVTPEYFEELSENFPVTGYIDDLAVFIPRVTFVLNQNIYAGDLKYDSGNAEEFLLGPGYLLLRDEFHGVNPIATNSVLTNVMITLGGSDDSNLTGELIKEITTAHPELTLHVVVGAAFAHSDALELQVSQSGNPGNILLYHSPKMSNLMRKMDLAVSACGSTVYELAVCGVPTIGIVTANNQMMLAEKMAGLGLMKYLRNISAIGEVIDSYDYKRRLEITDRVSALFNPDGAEKAADRIKELVIASKLT